MKLNRLFKTCALTLASTLIVSSACRFFLLVPETRGLLSMGEPLFFASAILLGQYSGAFVGGVGFALADLLLGYPHYILAALTVKATSGFVVGKFCRVKSAPNKLFSFTSNFMLVALLGFSSIRIYSGVAYFGYAKILFLGERIMDYGGLDVWRVYIPTWFWAVITIILFFYFLLLAFKGKSSFGWVSFSFLAGALITALGYAGYEVFVMPHIFNVEVDAVTNIPINIGQSILSAAIALFIVEMVHFGTFYITRKVSGCQNPGKKCN
jgi:uncharacterized membrane protein